jgi:uroporphyrinogen-III synthase
MRLLVTRPQPDAARTAAALRARGHETIVAPLVTIEHSAPAIGVGHPWDAVLLTSANAARALAEHPQRADIVAHPVFTVGRQSGAAARIAGFADITTADGNASDLVRLLASRFAGSAARLLYLAGEDRAADLARELAPHGLAVATVTLYRARAAGEFPPGVTEALRAGRVDGVLHFSRRSAEAFCACAQAAGVMAQARRGIHYCLSPQVADPLRAAGAADVRVAPRPDEAALLGLITPGHVADTAGA